MDNGAFGTTWRERSTGACVLAILVAVLSVLPGARPAFAISLAEPTDADLRVQASDAGAFLGQVGRLVYVVWNAGPATATNVTVSYELPPGLSPAPGESCSPTGSGYICTVHLGTYVAGESPRSSLVFRADALGSYDIKVSVTSDQPDPDLSNNTATGTVVVMPTADVSVGVTDSADPSRPGRPVTYTVTVSNNGPSPATAVTLTDTWQTTTRGVRPLSVSTTQGTCSPASGTGVTCQLGALAIGGTASVTIALKPRGKGSLTDTASVRNAELDFVHSNDTDSETTTVGAAKSP